MIAYLASDLLWATKIKSTADAIGVSARPARTLEMLEARLGDSDVRGLIVDLEAPADVAMAVIRRGSEAGVHVVAFGPHVATDALAGAKAAGARTALARGAFAANLPDIIRGLDSDPG